MARSQVFPAAAAFETPIGSPAWNAKSSWALIATEDRAINPAPMLSASHAVFASKPEEVANLIEAAANALALAPIN